MLQMEKLQKVYRTEMVETYALRDFNLTVNEGEFVAVTGPSGSGKTTFLTIAGLLEAFSGGSYRLDGIDVSRMGDRERSAVRNQKIGFIFQAFNLIPVLHILQWETDRKSLLVIARLLAKRDGKPGHSR